MEIDIIAAMTSIIDEDSDPERPRHFAMDPFGLLDHNQNTDDVSYVAVNNYNRFTLEDYCNANIGLEYEVDNTLHQAVITGNYFTVNEAIQDDQFGEIVDLLGYTPLHYAAMLGLTQMVQLLLKADCCINSRALNQVTPLHMACYHNHNKVVTALLHDRRIDINARGSGGFTSLHLAAELGHLKIVELLIAARAEINARSMTHDTPLHLALGYRRWRTAKHLLENGSDANAMSSDGGRPLHVAIINGSDIGMTELLISKTNDVNATQENQYTALHFAAKSGRWQIVKLLLQRGAKPHDVTDQGMTPLHLTAYSLIEEDMLDVDYCMVARYLKLNGIDVMSVDNWHHTALHHAVKYGTVRLVQCLLEELHADVNAGIDNSKTPLHFVTKSGNSLQAIIPGAMVRGPSSEVVKLLIEHGAIVNAQDEENLTPLHLAAEHCGVEVVKLLLEAGSFYDSRADTPTHQLPIERAYLNAAQQEISHTLGLVHNFLNAVRANDIVMVRACLGSDYWMVNCWSVHQMSPLLSAIEDGNVELIVLLLDHRAVANRLPPFHYATMLGHLDIVSKLLSRGANANLSDIYLLPSLHYAVMLDRLDIVLALLQNKFDVNRAGINRLTPLQYANKLGHHEIALTLLKHEAVIDACGPRLRTPRVMAIETNQPEIA